METMFLSATCVNPIAQFGLISLDLFNHSGDNAKRTDLEQQLTP
jgi:hypothetical protein